MNELFSLMSSSWLARASAQSAALVGMVLLVQWVFQKRLPAKWRHTLWWLVVIRLVLPLTPSSPFSAFNWLRFSQPAASIKTGDAGNTVAGIKPQVINGEFGPKVLGERAEGGVVPQGGRTAYSDNVSPALAGGERQPQDGGLQLRDWLFVGWLSGVLLLAVWMINRQLQLYHRLRGGEPVGDAAALALLKKCSQAMGVAVSPQLIETGWVVSPALCGLWKPRILLPKGMLQAFSEQQLRHVFLHELAHLRRRDIAVNWLAAMVQVMHWFNPVVWYGLKRMRADSELACDELALNHAKADDGRAYGETIIKLLESAPQATALPGVVGILEDRRDLVRRIGMIALFGKVTRWPALAAVLGLTLAIVGLTDAQTTKPSQPEAKLAKEQSSSWNGELLFQVVDDTTGHPLTNAELRVTGCDDTGCHLIGNLQMPKVGPASIHYDVQKTTSLIVRVKVDGYVPKIVVWSPRKNDLIDGQYIARLAQGVTIGGYVKDQAGKGVEGVQVGLDGPGIIDPIAREQDGFESNLTYVTTDASGKWVCNFAPKGLSKIYISLQHPDYAGTSYANDSTTDNVADRSTLIPCRDLLAQTAVLLIQNGVAVLGTVADMRGKPIAGARVLLGSKYERKPMIEMTDAGGRFEFKNSSLHERTVTVQAKGFAPDLQVVSGKQKTNALQFKLQSGVLYKGRVVDEDGRPLEGITVTCGTALWRGHQTLDWDETTDGEGKFLWDSGPTEGVQIGFIKAGYQITEIHFAPDGKEREIKLVRSKEISGVVADAVTHKPIDEFLVTMGGYFEVGPQKNYNWESFSAARGRNGQFKIQLERNMQALKIEAEGYLPKIVDDLTEKDFGRRLDFELTPGSGPQGIVVSENGDPVAGAEVAQISGGKYLELRKNGFTHMPDPTRAVIVRTDEKGGFSLPAEAAATSLVAVHSTGFVEVPVNATDSNYRLVLQQWGRIEGVAKIGSNPATNASLALSSKMGGFGGLSYHLNDFSVSTDASGHFVFDRVPPGERVVSRLIPISSRAKAFCYPVTVKVEAGATSRCQVGGKGRQVIGRAAVEGKVEGIQWQLGNHRFGTRMPRPPAGLKTPEEFRAWDNQPDIKAVFANMRNYPVIFSDDGSFHIDDVEAGTYELNLQFTKESGMMPGFGSPIASGHMDVVVPEMPGGRSDKVLYVGTVPVTPGSGMRGRPASAQFE